MRIYLLQDFSMYKAIIGAVLLSALISSAAEAALFVDKFQGNGAGGGGLTRADLVIAGSYFTPNQSLGNIYNTINFSDSPPTQYGLFPDSTNLWPIPTLNDDFVVHVYGFLNVSTPGTYVFTTFNDDGVRLRIDGTTLFADNGYHATSSFTNSINLTAGQHTIDLVFFEGSGQATLELSVRTPTGPSYLLGDTAFGLISTSPTAVAAVPEPSSMLTLTGLALSFAAGKWVRRLKQKKALLAWIQIRSN